LLTGIRTAFIFGGDAPFNSCAAGISANAAVCDATKAGPFVTEDLKKALSAVPVGPSQNILVETTVKDGRKNTICAAETAIFAG
jgi:hypothetical protein